MRETNAGHMALDHVERWNDTTRETKAGKMGRLGSTEMVLHQVGQKLSAAALEASAIAS